MKTKDICKQYGLKLLILDEFIKSHGFQYKDGITGLSVEDSQVSQIVAAYKEEAAKLAQKEEEEKKIAENEAQRKKKAFIGNAYYLWI